MRASLALAVLFTVTPALAQSPLVLPVTGAWLVVADPPSTPNTSHGFELVPLDAFGRPDTTCLYQPVLSPTDGTVVEILDAYPNVSRPGQHRFGNHIVIQRSEHEFIVLGSLAHGSFTLAVGDPVTAGEAIAACGFSGESGRSALHVHMQASRDILDADSPGLPMPFSNLAVRTPGGCRPTLLLYGGQGIC